MSNSFQNSIKIPEEVLINILLVYECCTLENLGGGPDLICDCNRIVYTTWSDIISIRERIKNVKSIPK